MQGEESKSATLFQAKIFLCCVPSLIMKQIFYGCISKPRITEIRTKTFRGSTCVTVLGVAVLRNLIFSRHTARCHSVLCVSLWFTQGKCQSSWGMLAWWDDHEMPPAPFKYSALSLRCYSTQVALLLLSQIAFHSFPVGFVLLYLMIHVSK